METITIHAGDTVKINYTVMLNGAPVNLTGLTLKWAARRSFSDITYTDPANGIAQVTLLPSDTASLAVSVPATYYWTLRLYDGTNVYTVAEGVLEVHPVAQRATD